MDYGVFGTGHRELDGKGCSSSHYILTHCMFAYIYSSGLVLDNGLQRKQSAWVRLYCRAVNEHGMLGFRTRIRPGGECTILVFNSN